MTQSLEMDTKKTGRAYGRPASAEMGGVAKGLSVVSEFPRRR